jgi:predicted ATPase/DNA-binding SARP family transcriptional activator
VRIAVLGPLEVRDGDGAPVEVTGARLRTLLSLLALAGGGVTSTDRLVDGLWGEHPPAGAANALQALVSRLRRALPDAVIEAHPAGYRLVVGPDVVDVARFERLVARGRAALADDPATAGATLREALALWRGPALLDAAGAGFAAAAVARLDELRLSAVEDRVEADLRLGRGAEVVTELAELVAAHPLRERLAGALMRALCAAGRPAEALTVFERARTVLADELGADPSPELAALHVSILRGDQAPARTNLRAGLTSFVGRDEDLARVGALVRDYRLTTLTGPGGSGKTRLSVEVAREHLARLPDGVWLVELAPVSDGADIPGAVLAVLGVRDHMLGGRAEGEPIDRLAAALGARRVLLVLDNCEHVVDAAAALADRLLGECPGLRILATSREPLGITGEALWPVEPLALPPADTDAPLSYAAVRLLVDRAGAARPGLTLDDDAAVRICRALDGMPLAIELAAARLRTMSATQLAARLDDRFRLLTGGSRVALPRHQTLRAVVDWSWDLLSAEERALWRRLAVFAGGATLAAVERVCGIAPERVLDLLTALAEKSLVVTDGERYWMLETIRAYGLARLAEAGERERLRQAHAAHFVELAESAEPGLRRHDQLVWLARLAAEHDNLTAAIRSAVAAGDEPTAVRMVAAAGWYWWLRGHKAEGAALAAEALALPEQTDGHRDGHNDTGHRAAACAMAALLALDGLRDERRAGEWFRTALRLAEHTKRQHPLLRLLPPIERVLNVYRDTEPALPVDVIDPLLADDDPWVRGTARSLRAHMLLNFGSHTAEVEADFTAALAEFRTVGERWGISLSLTSLADLAAWRGEFATAIDRYEQALTSIAMMTNEDAIGIQLRLAELRRRTGDRAGSAALLAEADAEATRRGLPEALASVAHTKGDFARWDGDLATARAHLTQAVAISRGVTVAPQLRAVSLDSLGYVAALTGDLAAAHAHHAEALEWAIDSVDAPVLAQVLVGIAHLALCQGRPAKAAALLAGAEAVRGTPDLSRVDTAEVAAATRAALGDEFASAFRAGERTTLTTVRKLAATVL